MLDAFMVGKVAMLTCDSDFMLWVENAEKSTVAGRVGYAPFPAGPAGRVTNSWAHGLAMSKPGCRTEREKGAAALFIAWMTSKESELYRVRAGEFLQIARNSTLASPEFEEQIKGHPDWVTAFREGLRSAKPLFPRMPEWPQIGDYLGVVLEELFVGTRTDVKASLDEAVAQAVKVLEKK
jgi:multiple sugar transport system substrate-binding protein